MAVIAVTRLRVRRWRYLPAFLWYSLGSARQSAKSPGNLASQVLKDRQRTFWTATAWSDEAAMKAFILAPPHRVAMRKLLEWCDEAALVHWTQEVHRPPDWASAYVRLRNEGRRSKVNHPSAAHTAYEFPPPRVRRTSALRLR